MSALDRARRLVRRHVPKLQSEIPKEAVVAAENPIRSFLDHVAVADESFVIADIGARGGWSKDFASLAQHARTRFIAAEPEAKEAARIAAAHPDAVVLPFALGEHDGTGTLKLTRELGCASMYEPNTSLLGLYPIRSWFEVERRVEVEVRRYDSLVDEFECPEIDFLKIDTQGYELEVLKGIGSHLTPVCCIELEAHVLPLYEGQALLTDICAFLFAYGFELITLRQQGRFEGAAIEYNAFFIKRHELMSDQQLRKSRLWQMLKNVFRSPASMTPIRDDPSLFNPTHTARYLRPYDIEKFDAERALQAAHRRITSG